ncbi:hypothetical protein [Archangium sp.]|uniref:hypothetical protein n=1 Tax=Archangium sp. TaxID=1872627 RepID=UPI002D2B72DE|nr:hypothetical protein [Archangium sp.]HYO52351.1 hypothetical protein [Archangium sp.]
MHRRVLIALLAFGTLAGYTSGFASLYRWHRYGGHCRQDRASEYNPRSDTAPWAPSQAPTTDPR